MSGKRELILDTAVRLFTQQGIGATSMERIAEAVPVSKMTIYKYFRSKEGLLEQVIQRMLDQVLLVFRDKVVQAVNPFEALLQMGKSEDYADLSDEFIKELLEEYPHLAAQIVRFQKEQIAPELEQMIFRCQQNGIIRKDISPHVLVLYMMGLKEFFSKGDVWQGVSDIRSMSEQLMTILYYGIYSDEHKEKAKGS